MTVKHSYDSGSAIDQHHILPSNNPRHALDDADAYLRSRQPLSDSAGNSQLQLLAGLSTYDNSKLRSHRYTIPSLPFQASRASRHAHRPPKNAAQLRKEEIRQQRHYRHIKNPIVDQPQYKAYRQRQAQEGKGDEQKWPDILEESFLDALVDIPSLGRRKFSYKQKPHGRNELIQEYIWLAYCHSLPPGQKPDPVMRRHRKQVSSHIQVLKHFLKGTPAFDMLFPKKLGPRNGFEDNFKSDPTLRALSEGRLPSHRLYKYESVSQSSPIKPAAFWIKMTSCHTRSEYSETLKNTGMYSAGLLAHQYTGLSSQGLRASLESIEDWRIRFPYLAQLHAMEEAEYDIIHMDVALQLTATHAPEGSDLIGRITMSIPGRELADCVWQSVTTLSRPRELLRDPSVDPLLEAIAVPTEVLAVSDTETQLKVPFPANAWAHALTSLTNIQLAYEERKNVSLHKARPEAAVPSVRRCIEQITMYQELESRSGPNVPFVKRAILLWTFRKARIGEPGTTTWRYIDLPPPRQAVMSPPVPLSHHELAGMSENFGNWRDTPLPLQSNLLESFAQDMEAPTSHSHSAGLQSPFQHMPSRYSCPTPSFGLPHESMSFVSEPRTLNSEPTTLTETDSQHQEIDNYLVNANVHVGLEYDNEQAGQWHLNTSVTGPETYEGIEWAGYSVAPAPTPVAGWHAEQGKGAINGTGVWDDINGEIPREIRYESVNEGDKINTHESWMTEGLQNTHYDFGEHVDNHRPMLKQSQSFTEHGLDTNGQPAVKRSRSFMQQTYVPQRQPQKTIKHLESLMEQHVNGSGDVLSPSHHTGSFDEQAIRHATNAHSARKHTQILLEHALEQEVLAPAPVKHPQLSIEQTLEEKLAPWVSRVSSVEPKGLLEVSELELSSATSETIDELGGEGDGEEHLETQDRLAAQRSRDDVDEGEEVDVSMVKEEWSMVESGFGDYDGMVS